MIKVCFLKVDPAGVHLVGAKVNLTLHLLSKIKLGAAVRLFIKKVAVHVR